MKEMEEKEKMLDLHSVCVCAGRGEAFPGGNRQEEDPAGQVSLDLTVLRMWHLNQQCALGLT